MAQSAAEGFDVVIAGTESTDGYSGVVPQQMAEFLETPALTFAKKVELDDDTIRIERQTEYGYDIVESPTPVLITVTAGVVEPRYPTFKGIMAAKSKPIDQITACRPGRNDRYGSSRSSRSDQRPSGRQGKSSRMTAKAHLRIIATPRTGKGDLDVSQNNVGFC